MKRTKGRKKAKGEGRASAVKPPTAEIAVTQDWVRHVQIRVPEPKQAISFRVDSDVLDFFKEQGPRYQTRMNAVLRAYMTVQGGEEKA